MPALIAGTKPQGSPTKMLLEKHADYLNLERNISQETAVKLGLVSHPSKDAIGFPNPNATGFSPTYTKYRDSSKKFCVEPTGQTPKLWNLINAVAANKDWLIITEGEIDACSFVQGGFDNVVSVPNGASGNPTYLFDDAGELLPELRTQRKILLAVDNDEPGIQLTANLAKFLGPERCYVTAYPKGCKDPNDVLVKYGNGGIQAAVKNAKPLIPTTFRGIYDVTPIPRGGPFSSGWSELDKHLLLCPPELITVVGKPGHGKSQFITNLMLNYARLHGHKIGFMQLEDGVERLQEDAQAYERYWKLPKLWAADYIRVLEPMRPDHQAEDMDWLCSQIIDAATKEGCKAVVVDPLNEIVHNKGRKRDDEYYAEAIMKLKRIAKRYQIAIVLVCHPDKWSAVNVKAEDMDLFNVNGGAMFNNKSDGGIAINLEEDADGNRTGYVIVRVVKRKDQRRMGYPGDVRFQFDLESRTYQAGR